MTCLKHKQKYGKGEWCVYCGNPNGNTFGTTYVDWILMGNKEIWYGIPGLTLRSTHDTVKKVQEVEEPNYTQSLSNFLRKQK